MALELVSANERAIVIRGNRDGSVWRFAIRSRDDRRELVEVDEPLSGANGSGVDPVRDYPSAYRFAYDAAVQRNLVDVTEGE